MTGACLCHLCVQGFRQAVEELVASGCDVNAPSPRGTALLKLLKAACAERYADDGGGPRNDWEALARVLLEAGADPSRPVYAGGVSGSTHLEYLMVEAVPVGGAVEVQPWLAGVIRCAGRATWVGRSAASAHDIRVLGAAWPGAARGAGLLAKGTCAGFCHRPALSGLHGEGLHRAGLCSWHLHAPQPPEQGSAGEHCRRSNCCSRAPGRS